MRIITYASSYSTEVERIFNVWWLSVQRGTTLENLTDPYDHETIWTNFKIGSGCFQKNENEKNNNLIVLKMLLWWTALCNS